MAGNYVYLFCTNRWHGVHVPQDPLRANLFLELQLDEGAQFKERWIRRTANCVQEETSFPFFSYSELKSNMGVLLKTLKV